MERSRGAVVFPAARQQTLSREGEQDDQRKSERRYTGNPVLTAMLKYSMQSLGDGRISAIPGCAYRVE